MILCNDNQTAVYGLVRSRLQVLATTNRQRAYVYTFDYPPTPPRLYQEKGQSRKSGVMIDTYFELEPMDTEQQEA